MKHILIFVLFALLLSACEDKIDIRVPLGPSQLAVDGKLVTYYKCDFLKPLAAYEPSYVTLKMTGGYDDGPLPTVNNAQVIIIDISDPSALADTLVSVGGGRYATKYMVGVIGHIYQLKITHNGNTYISGDQMKRVPELDSIVVENRTEPLYGRAPGYYLNLQTKDLEGAGDYYRIKSYKNSVLFNRPNEINIAYDAGFGRGTVIDGQKFVFPVAVQILNPITGVLDDKTFGDKSTFVLGDTARVEIWSLSIYSINFYSELRNELTNEGLFARPAVNLPCNIFNENPDGPKAVGWFSASAVSGKDVIIK